MKMYGDIPTKKKLRMPKQTETKYVQEKKSCGIERGVVKKRHSAQGDI
jgi:hypothetical protein